MEAIKIGIVGIGNCASSLVQGIEYYKDKRPEEAIGLMHWEIGGYRPCDIEVVAAFDIDTRKVGSCTTVFCRDVPKTGVRVRMGRILDGVADHMKRYRDSRTFLPSDERDATREEIVLALRHSGAEVLVNYLPVGSEEAACFYAECALDAGIALVNCIPVFIVSNPEFSRRFQQKGIPIVGDDIKAQLGATITHHVLTDLFRKRGVKLEHIYQLNTGGNTDFLNMLNRSRLSSKKESKTEAVQSVAAARIVDENIHVGPSDPRGRSVEDRRGSERGGRAPEIPQAKPAAVPRPCDVVRSSFFEESDFPRRRCATPPDDQECGVIPGRAASETGGLRAPVVASAEENLMRVMGAPRTRAVAAALMLAIGVAACAAEEDTGAPGELPSAESAARSEGAAGPPEDPKEESEEEDAPEADRE